MARCLGAPRALVYRSAGRGGPYTATSPPCVHTPQHFESVSLLASRALRHAAAMLAPSVLEWSSMSQLFEVLHYIQALRINPLAGVIVAALLAAFLDQRRVRGRPPPVQPPPRPRQVLAHPSAHRRPRPP